MSHPVSQVVILAIAGVIAVLIGGLIQLDPAAFHAQSGIEVGSQMALINELKAVGGSVLALGMFALIAIKIVPFRPIALASNALAYGGYGAARTLSFVVDGVPNTSLLWIAGLEIAVAAACAAALYRSRQWTCHGVSNRLISQWLPGTACRAQRCRGHCAGRRALSDL